MWTNGDFESDSIGTSPPSGWTLDAYLDPGITDLRPNVQTLASLNLAAGGAAGTEVIGGTAETQTDPDIGASGTLRYPKYGTRAALINKSASVTGTGRNVNSLKQQMTVGIGDVDSTDNKVHVRFAVAPVLENPSHSYTSQPYYFVRLQNLTRGTTLYSDFNASGQPGVPWKNFTDTSGQAAQYTDWQLVDISPGNAALAVGDQVELFVLASGCSAGGHWGRLYVDAVGSGIPGLFAWATGAQQTNDGDDLTYTINYKNGGTTTTSGSALDLVTPPNTVYKATSGTGCTEPSVGATGTVSCPLGTLAPGSTGSFTVTVTVPSGTAAGTTITNGNYSIYASGISALVGPKVYTSVTSGTQYANLGITMTDGVAAIGFGQPDTYTMVVSNAGPLATTATVADTMPAQLTGVTWACSAAGGGSCTASGSGDISDAVTLPVGATLTYTIQATTIAGSGTVSMVNQATVTPTGGISDPDSTDNTAVDTDTIGTLRTLALTKGGPASGGSVTSTPAAISCGAACGSASADFLDGSQVLLTAAPAPGAAFAGWGGACSGTATTCTVTMSAATSVSATFVGAPAATTVSSGSPQSTATSTAFASPLAVLVTDASGTPLAGIAVTFSAPGSGATASLSSPTATTDASGVAQVTATANTTAGSYTVTASITGVTPTADFALTNLGVPASIAVSSGSGQSATVAAAFGAPLIAVVLDAGGQPVPGATVTFTAPASGASATLASATATTDASGLATTSATAGSVAGSYTVTASVTGVASPASFSLSNTAGAAATLAVQSGSGQSATVSAAFAAPLIAHVSDSFGNPVAGTTVTFTAAASGARATLSTGSASTDASGLAQVTATAGSIAGAHSVTASAAGLGSVSFALTNSPGAPAAITIVGGGGQSAIVHTAFSQALTVLVADAFGNPAPGATVSFTAPASGATATVPGSATSDASGIASTAATAGDVAGGYSVVAAISGHTASFTLINLPGAPASIAFTGGGSQSTTVGTAFASPLAVHVLDAFGNPCPGAAVTLTGPASGAGLATSPLSLTTDAAGAASTAITANHTSGGYSVTAAVTGAASSPTAALTNLPGAATALAKVSGDAQHATVTAAFAAALVVRATDTFGNAVPGATVTFTTSGPATFAPSTATTAANGQASTTATAGTTAGAYTVTAAITGASTTFALTNDPGAPATVAVSSGGGQTATVATAFAAPLTAVVSDAHGNHVPGATVAFAAPGAGARATLSAPTATTDAAGRCSITATAGQIAGTYAVTASASGATSASFAMTNTPAAVATLTATGGGGQEAIVLAGFAQPLAVHAADAFGNPVPGATIAFTAPGSGPTASLDSGGAASTDASGDAQLAAVAGTLAGSYLVTASTGAAPAITFALTNLPGAPVAIAIVDGDPQHATVAQAFAAPLRARVSDAQGNPVPGATVRFTAALSAASATLGAPTATTDAAGVAAMTATANTVAGAHEVTASLAAGASAPFELTNVADVPATIAVLPSASPQQMTVLQPYASPLAVLVTDQYGNPAPGATVTYSAPATGPTATLSTDTATTDETGTAMVTATADGHAGSFLVYAAVAGIADPAPFTLTNSAGSPATLVIDGGDSQTATVDTDFATALAVSVLDTNGNPVPGAVVSFTAPATPASATLAASSAQTDAGGVARMIAHATTTSGMYQVTAALAGAAASANFTLTNAAGAPAAITARPGSTPQNAEVNHELQQPLGARVVDQFGNGVPGVTVTYTAPAGPVTATLAAATAVSDADGQVSVVATAGTAAGTYAVTAAVVGLDTPATFSLGNLAGPAQTVTATAGAPQDQIVALAYAAPLVVRVTDAFDNPVADATVTFAAPAQGPTATVDQPSVATGADGTAQTTLTAGTVAGTFTITATTVNGSTPAVFELTASPGAPASATALENATPQSAEVQHAFAQPLALAVSDSYGNRVPGATVAFAAPSAPGAQLSAASATTGRDGIVQVSAIADDTAGTYQVTATISETIGVTFALANTPTSPASVVVTSGGAQRTLATTAFPQPITVRVFDSFGNPVGGVPVTLTMPSTGPTAHVVGAPPVNTDADGAITVSLTAGPLVGTFTFSAQAVGALGAGTTTLEVLAIPTTTSATTDDSTSVDRGAAVTITVHATIGQPSGMVEIIDSTGATYGTALLTGGVATIPVTGLTRGTYSMLARFAAQGSYGASASTAVTFTVTDDARSLSGGGCAAGGSPSPLGAIAGLLVVLALRRRRQARLAVAAVAALGALAALPGHASAEPRAARAINRYHAASPDSAWFALDTAAFRGEREVALSVIADYADQPLSVYLPDGTVSERIVTGALITHFGASVTIRDVLRLSGNAPLATWQGGNDGTYNGMALAAPGGAFGDVTLAADLRIAGDHAGAWQLAAGARFGFPTGSRSNYMSDGRFSVEPRLLATGARGRLEYAAEASAFLRRSNQVAGTSYGSELRYQAAAGVRFAKGRALIGPELIGAAPLEGGTAVGTPLELQLGVHYQASSQLRLGVGGGAGLINAVGEPRWRMLLSLGWNP